MTGKKSDTVEINRLSKRTEMDNNFKLYRDMTDMTNLNEAELDRNLRLRFLGPGKD